MTKLRFILYLLSAAFSGLSLWLFDHKPDTNMHYGMAGLVALMLGIVIFMVAGSDVDKYER